VARPSTTSRLILVDGFAGIGKSTTAQQLWYDLTTAGQRATWLHEHESEHPIFQYGEVEDLLSLTASRFEARLLAAWEAFAGHDDGQTVRITEASFFQIPVGVMLSLNVPPHRIRKLLLQIEHLIGRLDPALVYLYSADLGTALNKVGDDRGMRWLETMTAVVAQSRYGRAHRVRDISGLIEFYRRQRAIIDSVLPKLTLRRVAIDVGDARWDRYRRRIGTFVGIRPAELHVLRPTALLRHVGHYRGTTTGRTSVVTTDAQALYLQQPSCNAQPLMRVSPGHFCLKSLPIDVRFSYRRNGEASRFVYDSRMVNEVVSDSTWLRV
jgi:hypothetical protein